VDGVAILYYRRDGNGWKIDSIDGAGLTVTKK